MIVKQSIYQGTILDWYIYIYMICIYCLHIYLPTYLGSLANDDVEEGENDERKHKSCFAFGILSLSSHFFPHPYV